MRKLAIAMALTSTAIASPALARDDAWYIGVEAGASLVEDISYDINGASDALIADHDTGYDVDGIIGYDFGGFRLEAEVGYKEAGVTTLISTVTIPRPNSAGGINNVAARAFGGAGGDTSVLSFMLNGMLDFGDDDGLNGFVGVGGGVARVKASYAIDVFGNSLDDSDTGFAWQAIAGVRAPLNDHWDVGLKYRFFSADNVSLIDLAGRSADGHYRSHSILGSLIYNFGEPPAPPLWVKRRHPLRQK